MKITISYNKCQLEAAVNFVAKNNSHFFDMYDYIRDSIQKMMVEMAQDPSILENGTMGYIIVVEDRRVEDMEHEENSVHFEILVDPNLGSDEYQTHEEVIDV